MKDVMAQEAAMTRRRWCLSAGAGAAAWLAAGAGWAQEAAYPSKPIRLIVPFPAGGGGDTMARLVMGRVATELGQSIVVENLGGAGGNVGSAQAAKAAPDGYTLLVSSSGGLTTNPVLMKSLAYDPEKDFEPIALLATFPLVVTVPASLPVKNFAELVQFSKTHKDGRLDHGTPTTSFVLVAETLTEAAGVKFNHVQYKGSGPTVMGLLGGETQVAVLDSPAVIPHIQGGKLKALAVTTAKRSAALPDVPTVAEAGFAGYDIPIWTALMAPKGTPAPVLAKLRAAVGEILQDRENVQKMHKLGLEPGDTDGAALSKRISSDIARWRRVAKAANIQPQ